MKRLLFLMLLAVGGCSNRPATVAWASDFVIYPSGVNTNSGGTGSGCPGTYTGYANYTKTAATGWGWRWYSGTNVHTASVTNAGLFVKIQYGGRNGDTGCNTNSVTIPHPPISTVYRFTVYRTNGVPTTNDPLILSGFLP